MVAIATEKIGKPVHFLKLCRYFRRLRRPSSGSLRPRQVSHRSPEVVRRPEQDEADCGRCDVTLWRMAMAGNDETRKEWLRLRTFVWRDADSSSVGPNSGALLRVSVCCIFVKPKYVKRRRPSTCLLPVG